MPSIENWVASLMLSEALHLHALDVGLRHAEIAHPRYERDHGNRIAAVQRELADLFLLDDHFYGRMLGLNQFDARLDRDLLFDVADRKLRRTRFCSPAVSSTELSCQEANAATSLAPNRFRVARPAPGSIRCYP